MNTTFKLIFILFFIFISSTARSETYAYIKYLQLSEFIKLKFNPPTYEGELKFSSSTYKGELKNGKAHGLGTMTFSDGTKYVGQFKKNIIHGNGKYTDQDGNIISGKWTHGKFYNKIDFRNREVIKLNIFNDKKKYFQTRGTGNASNLWFEAEPKFVKIEEVKLGLDVELDIFDLPSAFSPDYGDEEKIKELLAAKKTKMLNEMHEPSEQSGVGKKKMRIFVITEKGEKNLKSAKSAINNTTGQHGSSGSMGAGGC